MGEVGWGDHQDHLDLHVGKAVAEETGQLWGEAGNFLPLTKEVPWKVLVGDQAELRKGGIGRTLLNQSQVEEEQFQWLQEEVDPSCQKWVESVDMWD